MVVKIFLSQFTRFCRKYVLSRFTHFCVEKKLSKNCLFVQKITNIGFVLHFYWNTIEGKSRPARDLMNESLKSWLQETSLIDRNHEIHIFACIAFAELKYSWYSYFLEAFPNWHTPLDHFCIWLQHSDIIVTSQTGKGNPQWKNTS